MSNELISKNEGVFCMLNCFDNYSIVASKIIEFYIQNAAKVFLTNDVNVDTMSYFEKTPYMLYSLYLLAQQTPDSSKSKQYTDYITILSLTAVTLARIFDSRITVFPHQGVTQHPGFATMYAYANMMNKNTVYWTDDLRNLWGTSDDPLMIGMAPLPYKYLWNATPKPGQPIDMNPQNKGLNSDIHPNIGSDKNLCPPANEKDLNKKWNTFWKLFKSGEYTQQQNTSGINKRMKNLIIIGRNIIQYVEIDKVKISGATFGNGNWVPGPGPNFNPTLFFDIQSVILNPSNIKLLYKEEQDFIKVNNTPINSLQQHSPSQTNTNKMYSPRMSLGGVPNAHINNIGDKKQLLADAMMKGFQMMNQTEENYKYFDYF